MSILAERRDPNNPERKPMNNLILVRGLPGSGKSSFARGLTQTHHPEAKLHAADDFFTAEDGTYRWKAKHVGSAHQQCQRRTLQDLRRGGTVIVHNTFTMSREFDAYLAMVVETNADLQVYSLFDSGLTDEQLAERNLHQVPVDAIRRMRERFCNAPVSEITVHSEDGYAYWQYPAVGYVEMTNS